MRVLYITSEWPTEEFQWGVPFIVREVESLRQIGIDIDVFVFRGRKKITNYFDAYRRLNQRLRQEPFDLVHAQFGQSGFVAAINKLVPLVITYQGTDLHGIYTQNGYSPITPLFRIAMNFAASRADEVILVSGHMSRFLRRSDYHVIPGGVDLDVFKPAPQKESRAQLGLPLNKRIVLFVGNPNRAVKRHFLAKNAVEIVQSRSSEGIMFLVASGVQPNDIPIYMNAADVLLLTSRHEGSPNVVKEALACNLPIVSVDVGDVRVRLDEVTPGTVVESDHPEMIAQALLNVLESRQRSNGRATVSELSMLETAKKVMKVYEKATQNNSKLSKT